MAQSDILIGFPEPLTAEQSARLIRDLSDLPGVARIATGRHGRRLVQVFFDPERIAAARFLATAREAGAEARLIGA